MNPLNSQMLPIVSIVMARTTTEANSRTASTSSSSRNTVSTLDGSFSSSFSSSFRGGDAVTTTSKSEEFSIPWLMMNPSKSKHISNSRSPPRLVEILPKANPYAQLCFYRRDTVDDDNDVNPRQKQQQNLHDIFPTMVVAGSHSPSCTTMIVDDGHCTKPLQPPQQTFVRTSYSCDSSSSLPTSASSWDSVDSEDDDDDGDSYDIGNNDDDESTMKEDKHSCEKNIMHPNSSPIPRTRSYPSGPNLPAVDDTEWIVDWFGWDHNTAAAATPLSPPVREMEATDSFPDHTWLLHYGDDESVINTDFDDSESLADDAVCGRLIRSVWTHHRRTYNHHYNIRYIHNNNRTNKKHNRAIKTESARDERHGRYISLS